MQALPAEGAPTPTHLVLQHLRVDLVAGHLALQHLARGAPLLQAVLEARDLARLLVQQRLQRRAGRALAACRRAAGAGGVSLGSRPSSGACCPKQGASGRAHPSGSAARRPAARCPAPTLRLQLVDLAAQRGVALCVLLGVQLRGAVRAAQRLHLRGRPAARVGMCTAAGRLAGQAQAAHREHSRRGVPLQQQALGAHMAQQAAPTWWRSTLSSSSIAACSWRASTSADWATP